MNRYALVFILGSLLTGLGLMGCTNPERGVEAADENNVPTIAEQDFMKKAAKSHVDEIDMARLARQQASNDDIKNFAEMLENDHQKALEDLSSMMTDNNVGDIKGDAEDKEHLDRMRKLSAAEFDRMYVDMMVGKHQTALET